MFGKPINIFGKCFKCDTSCSKSDNEKDTETYYYCSYECSIPGFITNKYLIYEKCMKCDDYNILIGIEQKDEKEKTDIEFFDEFKDIQFT